jgi:hypothetical protein
MYIAAVHSTWIGAKKIHENRWVWSADSTPVTNFHWGASEPNGHDTRLIFEIWRNFFYDLFSIKNVADVNSIDSFVSKRNMEEFFEC